MAETTTSTSLPAARAAATRRATARMRSGPSTEVPPYFWTRTAMAGSYKRSGPRTHPGGRTAAADPGESLGAPP